MNTARLLVGPDLSAAQAIAATLSCSLARVDDNRVLLAGTGDHGAVFAALEEAGYDVSHVVTGL